MGLLVERPGLLDLIQDLGRPGRRSLGVPPAGAFDLDSLALANALVGNPAGAPALELTLLGGDYLAEIPLGIALAGAPMAAEVIRPDASIRTLKIPQSVGLGPGDRLRVGPARSGARAYLAVRGGWLTPIVLGSRSTETPLRASDRLPASASTIPAHRPVNPSFPDPGSGPIRVLEIPGSPPVDWEGRAYRVSSRSDRMGIRLEGPPIAVPADPSRLSEPVAFGTIQVSGDSPMILGPSGGTMGGYPMVAQVISADLPRLGQARPGAEIRFARVGLDEARRLDRDRRMQRSSMHLRTSTLVGVLGSRPVPPTT